MENKNESAKTRFEKWLEENKHFLPESSVKELVSLVDDVSEEAWESGLEQANWN